MQLIFLYLEVGNYADILAMCYWDFLSILNSAKLRNGRLSHKPVVHNRVPQSNKDMIQRMKDIYG